MNFSARYFAIRLGPALRNENNELVEAKVREFLMNRKVFRRSGIRSGIGVIVGVSIHDSARTSNHFSLYGLGVAVQVLWTTGKATGKVMAIGLNRLCDFELMYEKLTKEQLRLSALKQEADLIVKQRTE